MSFRNEKEFQLWLAQKLKDSGEYLGHEVEVDGGLGRIDILTKQDIIECKPALTRESANEASGQLHYYQQFYPGKNLVIAVPEILDSNTVIRMRKSGVDVRCYKRGFMGSLIPAGVQAGSAESFWGSPLSLIILVVIVCFLMIHLDSQSKREKPSGDREAAGIVSQ